MSEKQTADEALKKALKAAQMFAVRGTDWNATKNRLVAQNILHEELGQFSDIQSMYDLDEATRNRLIAHTRQDAAHALCNTITLMEEVRSLRRDIRNMEFGFGVFCVAVGFWLWQRFGG
jgi:hypothetical protein